MSAAIQTAVAQMQIKRVARPEIWQNPNGTFSHHMDAQREWFDRDGCEMDLRLAREWAR